MGDLMKSETKAKWRQICVFFLAVLITAATFILLAGGILWQGSSNENANKNQLGETYTPPPPQNVALMFLWDEGGGDIFYLDFKEKKITATILPKNCDENAALVYGYHEFEAVKADFLLFSSIVDRLGGIDLEIKGENLRFTGIQAATLDSQIHTAATERNKSALSGGLGLIGGLAAVAIGIGTGGVGAAVMGGIAALASGANMIYNDKKIEYDLQHMQLPLKQVGAASGAISLTYDMRCKMRITRPKLAENYNSEVYANTVGFACLLNGNVKDFHGLTSGIIKLDNVPCTAEEKEYITSMFTNGVYLS